MWNFRRLASFVTALGLLAAANTVQALTVNVHCGGGYGLNTITAALNLLKVAEDSIPSTINVAGNCTENIVI